MKKLLTAITAATMMTGSATPITARQPQQLQTVSKKEIANKKCKVTNQWSNYIQDGQYLSYGFALHNPNTRQLSEFPKVKITAKDQDGKILASQTQVLFKVFPNDTVWFGGSINCSEQPTKVEMKFKNSNLVPDKSKTTSKKLYSISNTNILTDDEGQTKVTGEIEQTKKFRSDGYGYGFGPAITVVLKQDNRITYIYTTYIEELETQDKDSFEIPISSYPTAPEYDSFEVYAMPWS